MYIYSLHSLILSISLLHLLLIDIFRIQILLLLRRSPPKRKCQILFRMWSQVLGYNYSSNSFSSSCSTVVIIRTIASSNAIQQTYKRTNQIIRNKHCFISSSLCSKQSSSLLFSFLSLSLSVLSPSIAAVVVFEHISHFASAISSALSS